MSVQQATQADGDVLQRRSLLFTGGTRLGWIFRDRRELVPPYPEPAPGLEAIRAQAAQRVAAAQAIYRTVRRWWGMPSLIFLCLLLLAAGCAKVISSQADSGATLIAAVLLCGPGLAVTGIMWQKREQAKAVQPDQQYQQALAAWQQRAASYERAGLARLEDAAEWGSAEPPTRRVDIFGGNLWGWQALLTTHGTSVLASRPLLAVDLTGELASAELTATAQAARVPTVEYLLPADLGRTRMLSRLTPDQLADALTEAIHAGTPGGGRADRAVDVRVLEQLASALGDHITPARLAAAIQAALGHPDMASLLTAAEQTLIGGDLFPVSYRQQIMPNLVRLEAFLATLARHAEHDDSPGAGGDAPVYYTCLALESGARSARTEMLTALIIQWLTVQITTSTAADPAVIIAGADEITRPHLERLSGACERRGVPLTLLFQHLRDDSLAMLGGGTAAFMRLGNHAEAEQAASYIGRQHRFVLSQLTATLGGNQTHTITHTESHGVTDTISVGSVTGWRGTGDGGEIRSGSSNRSRGVSRSRNWSTALSWAQGTNWSDAATSQRVYEYTIEPTVLQNLPDHALLLVTRGATSTELRPVECDPAIVTLPRVSTSPLPLPAEAAQLEAAAQPVPPARPSQDQSAYLPPPHLPPPSPSQQQTSQPPRRPI